MKINFTDPVLFICIGILLIGFVFLVWAIGKLRQKKGTLSPQTPLDDDSPLSSADLGLDEPLETDFLREPVKPAAPAARMPPASAAAATATKDVAERLEAMTQRLSEMQTLLNSQTAAAEAAAANAPIGQGFSSETIDKLLKIIGSVTQQVDILQKAMNITKEPAASKPSVLSAPAAIPKPPVSSFQPVASSPPAPGATVPKPGPVFPPAGAPPKA